MSTAKTKILYILIFVVVLVLTYLVLNFIFKKDNEPKPIFLKVYGLWESDVFNAVKADFQKKNPEITIEYERRPAENYLSTLESDLAGESSTPDVFWWHSGWGPVLSKNLAKLPESIMSAEEYEKTFYPITKTSSRLGKDYVGLPLEIDGLALLYNKTIFASANFSEPPATWSSVRGVYGPALTTRDKQRVLNSAIALGSVNNVENVSEILGLFLLQNDVSVIKNKKLTLLDETADGTNMAADALEGYIDFSKTDKVWDNTLPNSLEAFATGKTAMVILPSGKIHELLSFVKKENLKLDFAVAPVPQLPDSDPVTWGSYWTLGVSQQSKQQEASWKLAKFLTEPEALRIVFKLESSKNDFGRAYPRKEMLKEQTTNPYLAAYLAQANTAKSWYLHSDTFDKNFNDKLVSQFKTATADLEQGTSATGALKSLVEKINPILKNYGLITDPPTK